MQAIAARTTREWQAALKRSGGQILPGAGLILPSGGYSTTFAGDAQ